MVMAQFGECAEKAVLLFVNWVVASNAHFRVNYTYT